MPPESDLLKKIRNNRALLLPRLELWRAEIQAQAEAANANPSYTLGKLLGYIGEVLRFPSSYSVEETKSPNGYYCKIILPENCTFINEYPSETAINAMISSTSLAVGAILEACFKRDEVPIPKKVKKRQHDNIMGVVEENTFMTDATATNSTTTTNTPPTPTAPAQAPSNGRPAPTEQTSLSSKKRKIEEVTVDSEPFVTDGGTYMEKLIGEGPDGQSLIDRTHMQLNLSEFTYRGLFAAITTTMKWGVAYKNRKTEDSQCELNMVVDPKDGHLPWMVSEVRPSEKVARDAAIKRFFQLLTDEGIFRVNPMLPPIETMKGYTPPASNVH
ncbi:hypothetical protein BC943DRAFT_313538 [Umbelopsis sp. AD052]|nr:hypothetical protein BC943DRAFT_313538 [Umbelopsis sp. AD052]